jgi:hypothetical protein
VPTRGDALGQALRLALGGLDVLARHGVGQFLQARDALVGQRLRGAQLGQLRGLVRAFDRRGGRHDVGQHLALADGLAGVGQAARAGFDAAGVQRLHLAAGVRVHHDLAVQLERARQLGGLGEQRAHAELALRRLGQEDAAVGQALRAVGAGCGRCVAVVVAFAGQARAPKGPASRATARERRGVRRAMFEVMRRLRYGA